jgi:hypothetical protein
MSVKSSATPGQYKRSSTTPVSAKKPSTSISPITIALAAALGLTSILLATTMKVSAFKYLVPFLPLAFGNNGGGGGYTGVPGAGLDGSNDGTKEYNLYADGVNATFIGYGARLTHMFVNDRQGTPRDIVVGYDTPAQYLAETKPSYFGAVVG